MADTIRSKADLVALLPDNTTNLISPQDVRDFLISVLDVQAGLQETTTRTVTGNEAPAAFNSTSLSGLANMAINSSGFSTTLASGTITAPVDGVYTVHLDLLLAPTDTQAYDFYVYLNGSPVSGLVWGFTLTGSGDRESLSVHVPLDLSANDDIQIYYGAGVDSSDFQVLKFFFWLERIG